HCVLRYSGECAITRVFGKHDTASKPPSTSRRGSSRLLPGATNARTIAVRVCHPKKRLLLRALARHGDVAACAVSLLHHSGPLPVAAQPRASSTPPRDLRGSMSARASTILRV